MIKNLSSHKSLHIDQDIEYIAECFTFVWPGTKDKNFRNMINDSLDQGIK